MVKKLLRRSWQVFDYEDVKTQRTKLLTSIESTLLSQAHDLEASQAEAPLSVYASILRRCRNARALEPGKRAHAHIQRFLGDYPGDFLANLLLQMYAKCEDLQSARNVFDSLQSKTVFTWNLMLTAYAHAGHFVELMELFHRMDHSLPNAVTYTSAFRACTALRDISSGRAIHERLTRNGGAPWDVVLGNTVIKMYSVCGSVGEAKRVFESMPLKNTHSWAYMLITYALSGHMDLCMEFYSTMNLQGIKLHRTVFPSFISSCCTLEQGRRLHESVKDEGNLSDPAIGNALVTIYGRFGELERAKEVFESMPEKNVITWTSFIAANAENGHWGEALCLFSQMKRETVRPNEVTYLTLIDSCTDFGTVSQGRDIHAEVRAAVYAPEVLVPVSNALVNMYGKLGSVREARLVFDSMRERNFVSWTSMLAAYAHQGHSLEALEVQRLMEVEGVEMDYVSFLSVLSALGHVGMVEACRLCFVIMVGDHGIPARAKHYNCMVDSFGRAGLVVEARELLGNMPFEPAYKEWINLLGSCKTHGEREVGGEAAMVARQLEPGVAQPYIMLLGTEE